MIRFSSFSAFAILASTQFALALSCSAPDVRENYQRAKASPHNYYIVEGKISLDRGPIEIENDADGIPVPYTRVQGILRGNSLGSSNKKTPFNHPVTIGVECVLDWCGWVQSNATVLAFVREEGGKYSIETGPCGGDLFPDPNANELSTIQSCLNGKRCKPPR